MSDFDIVSFGAQGDGEKDNSGAFAAAFDALRQQGGGSLRVGRGVWRTGPLELFSNSTLIVDEGAVISFIPEVERYHPVRTRWEGIECFGMHPLVFASEQEHISITGKGCFDGQGETWWNLYREKRKNGQKTPQTPLELELARLNSGFENHPSGGGGRGTQFLRPPFMQFFKCTDILFEGITLKESPFWTLHPVFCDTVVIRDIVILNPPDAPNTDGMDIDSCRNVLIEGCAVSVGDDGIALKSGSGPDGIRVNKPTCNVTIRGCTVKNAHGGVVIGSETAGGIHDVTAEDCLFSGTDRGIRIKTRRGRGGQIHDLNFRNLTMENNLCPLAVNMYYRCGADMSSGLFSTESQPITQGTPSIKNVAVSDIHAVLCRASAGFIAGLPESPIENFSIANSDFSTDENSPANPEESDMYLGLPSVQEKGFRLFNVKDPRFSGVTIRGPKQAFVYG